MNISDLLAIPIVGVILSFGIQWLKSKFDMSSGDVKAVTIVISIILGGAYWFLRDTNALTAIAGVLGSATVFWAYFIKPDTDKETDMYF